MIIISDLDKIVKKLNSLRLQEWIIYYTSVQASYIKLMQLPAVSGKVKCLQNATLIDVNTTPNKGLVLHLNTKSH